MSDIVLMITVQSPWDKGELWTLIEHTQILDIDHPFNTIKYRSIPRAYQTMTKEELQD